MAGFNDNSGNGDLSRVTKEVWKNNCFPEWGTWLNEEIDDTVVPANNFAMWWLGCTGIWVKTPGDANICIDLWLGTGKRGKHAWDFPYSQGKNFQMYRMNGGPTYQPNTRNIPMVIDPYEIQKIDAVLSTHFHRDHIDQYVAAAICQNFTDVPFIGPKFSCNIWREWGVPEDRIREVRPGDVIRIKDLEITAVDSFDRTALITCPAPEKAEGVCPTDMDDRAVSYVIRTPGGTLYHSGDSHFSNGYFKHGRDYDIDVALASFGENPPGLTDKMTSSDVLRMAENLRAKVVIPFHYDVWNNMLADPSEIEYLYQFKAPRLDYRFHVYIWQVGGQYIYPRDKDKKRFMFDRGFHDAFTDEPNLPFKSFL